MNSKCSLWGFAETVLSAYHTLPPFTGQLPSLPARSSRGFPPVRSSAPFMGFQGTWTTPAIIFMTMKGERLLIHLSPPLGSEVHRQGMKDRERGPPTGLCTVPGV